MQINKPIRKTDRPLNTTTSKINEAINTDLGCLISWRFTGKFWTPDHLRAIAQNHRLSLKIKDVEPLSGLSNAISNWKSKNDKNRLESKRVHLDRQNGICTVGILETEIDESNRRAKGVQIDTVTYDLNSKSFLNQGSTIHAISLAKDINKRVAHYTGTEFRKWIILPFLSDLKAIRIIGGLYFVSSKYSAEINAFEAFCDDCGIQLEILDQKNTKRTQKTISAQGKRSIFERIQEIQKTLSEWQLKKRIRKDGRDNLKIELGDLMLQAKMLHRGLSANVDDLTKALEDCRQELNVIEGKTPDTSMASAKTLDKWRNAMDSQFEKAGGYRIPFKRFKEFGLVDSCKGNYSWNKNKPSPHLRAINELGFTGFIHGQFLMLAPLKK